MLILQFLIGIVVGIYGYLMPGYINLSVFQLGMQVHKKVLYQVLLIISIIEFPYCFLSMSGMKWLMQQDIVMLVLKWLIVVVLFIVAIISFLDARKQHETKAFSTDKLEGNQIKKLLIKPFRFLLRSGFFMAN